MQQTLPIESKKSITILKFDHEKLDVIQASLDFEIFNRLNLIEEKYYSEARELFFRIVSMLIKMIKITN
jgi:hypothetical protein